MTADSRGQPQQSGQDAWHAASAEETLRAFGTHAGTGLADEEARRRLEQHGPNTIEEQPGRGLFVIFLGQMRETLVLLLIAAAGVSFALHDNKDGFAILAIVALNAALGVRQEYKAERAMEALRRLSAPNVTLRREGHVVELPIAELVPGDVALLEAGDAVPADCRLLEAANLRLDESALTGESTPVAKDAAAILEERTALGDRRNMVYRGSAVAAGRGLAVTTTTGMRTELGRIAGMLQTLDEERTPLQRRLDRLGKVLAAAALAIVAVVFAVGMSRGEELERMFLTAVSLAVAAVPEGLPAVVTIALALGAQRMLRRNALIRRLPAVETLGSVTVICSDKTGTLTENRMTLRSVVLPEGEVALDDERTRFALTAAALCTDAVLDGEHATGDPTEVALVEGAARAGLRKPELEAQAPRVAEDPFDSQRKRMATAHAVEGLQALPRPAAYAVFAKGGLHAILEAAVEVETPEGPKPLDEARLAEIEVLHDKLAEAGMRVLALAWRPADAPPKGGELEQGLIFIGLAGMLDPPRPEAADAVKMCQSAGIRTIMITGDHPKTAHAIAGEIGIPGGERSMTGVEIQASDEPKLAEAVAQSGIYARVSPEDKLRIVSALQGRGQIVAMTGDGVNDAPALKRADIGVSMGIMGSDVAKEAADMVLRDDNFATIVSAVEEGRVIFDNVRKFIRYLLSANCGELWVMLAGPLAGMPTPLAPLQILWMNLITDGPPALALGVEPAEDDVMDRPPAKPGESVFSHGVGRDILWIGVWMGTIALGIGWWYWSRNLAQWQTMIFVTLTLSQMTLALAVRSSRESFFRQGPRSNLPLTLAVLLSTALQAAVIYLEPLQEIFETTPLSMADLGVAAAGAVLVFAAVEIEKLLRRLRATS